MTGCASAEQRMESKRDYRDAQVEAIKVQSEQQTARATGAALAQAAMWDALREAVKSNPESASHFAIVMAVAAARSDEATAVKEGPMATLKTERDDTALDYVKVLAGPVLGGLTQVGIAALNTDLQKEISRNNVKAVIAETEQDGKLYDMVSTITSSRPEGGDTYNVTDNGVVVVGTQDNDTETYSSTNTTTTSTTTTTTSDDDIYVVNGDAASADDAIDEVGSFGIEDDITDTTTDETTEETTEETTAVDDCSYGFSPAPPGCTI